eukprot:9355350-Pyramimonas_sp.AAC.1
MPSAVAPVPLAALWHTGRWASAVPIAGAAPRLPATPYYLEYDGCRRYEPPAAAPARFAREVRTGPTTR